MHKRNRTKLDKILDALDTKIKNIEPSLRLILIDELVHLELTNVVKITQYVNSKLNLPELGSTTRPYWIARGWTEAEAHTRRIRSIRQTVGTSPFSREYWLKKINPTTELGYTAIEADFERNSIRPIRKEYWIRLGESEEESIILARTTKDNNNKNNNTRAEVSKIVSPRCIEYWMNKGLTEVDADIAMRRSQVTFSKDICINKHGVEEGTRIWSDRQERWLKSFTRLNYSKISQELFDEIILRYSGNVYYATYFRTDVIEYKNKEFRLKLLSGKMIMPDFIDIDTKKIVEFDGDYWHSEQVANPTKEFNRDKAIIESGYTVLHIKELNFKKDKQQVINECINFLTQ